MEFDEASRGLGRALLAIVGAAAFVTFSLRTQAASAVSDPRQEAPVVRLASARVWLRLMQRVS